MEESLRFVTDKLLRPIGVDLSVRDLLSAAEVEQECLPKMQTALYQFISWAIFESKAEARTWQRKAKVNDAIDSLRVLGFDPFLFSLDQNPQHVLLAICWLIWRTDLFKTAYDPYIPDEDVKYLPPYADYLIDPTITEPPPPRPPPDDPNDLTKRIQRLFSKVSMELHELSDIEMQRETFNWQIRAIDQQSSLYALSLKANVPMLTAHTNALRRAIINRPKIEELIRIEKDFWEWISPIANRPSFNPDSFDDSRATPIDWYPPLVSEPYDTNNKNAFELSQLLNQVKTKLANAKFAFGDLSKERTRGGGFSLDIIRREIDTKMDEILRYEPRKKQISAVKGESLIPNMPFKDFSDSELYRIINQSQDVCDEVAASACPQIKELAAAMIEDTGLEMHGWEIEKFERKRVNDDLDEVIPAEKVKLRAPRQTKATKQKAAARPHESLLGDIPKPHESHKNGSGIPQPGKHKSSLSNAGLKPSTISVMNGIGITNKKKKSVARRPKPEWNP